jgi:hypothetical protein
MREFVQPSKALRYGVVEPDRRQPGRSLIAPGQRQTCRGATTDTFATAIIFSIRCASLGGTLPRLMSGECGGKQLLRPAQGRPNGGGQGRPFYNRLRQRGAASIPVRNARRKVVAPSQDGPHNQMNQTQPSKRLRW